MTNTGRNIINRLLEKSRYLNFGRDIILTWCKEYIGNNRDREVRILDIGCGEGDDLVNIRLVEECKTRKFFGIEYDELRAKKAGQKGLNVFLMDIEKEPIPAEDEFFDIIIANQILEHTKEIFWIVSEVSRTIKKGGIFIVGVPNMASMHNRMLMLLGYQPTSVRVLGAHVRGFTAPAFKSFIEADGYFKLLNVRGANFYPFPPYMSGFFSRLLPAFSVSLYFLAERQDKNGCFINVLDSRKYQTPYFKGF